MIFELVKEEWKGMKSEWRGMKSYEGLNQPFIALTI